eukprot:TRINITY_DN35198_c0_g1_i2.p1 TRINITY_DN35198_c0_g1~~TRINITY_DN35198_c0_g1_i2.p1  ORF type:complete len:436 (-),score=144.34 TRINITY_DN35198_c0_g1_i2:166-1473(-)
MQNSVIEGQGGPPGQKHKYTFSQLISSVEDLKKKFEVLKSENNMLKENTDNIIKQVLNMESQLMSNGCIIEKFKSKSDEAFDQLLNCTKDKPEKPAKSPNSIMDEASTANNEIAKRNGTERSARSARSGKHRNKKSNNSTNIKIENVAQIKLNIKEEVDDNDYQELEEEACLDAEEEAETEAEYVEVQNTLKIETDESQANIFDIKEMVDIRKPVKKEPVETEPVEPEPVEPEPVQTESVQTESFQTEHGSNAEETDSNSNSSSDNDTDESDTDNDNDNDSVKPKEYSLKRLHMDLVEYLDRNRKKPKLTPTKKQSCSNSEEEVYCVCKSDYRADKPMIGCDGPCEDWYHFNCVGIPQDFRSIAEWYCEGCFLTITGGTRNVCLCGGTFEPAHELIRCRGRCRRLYHPGCLGLDNEDMVRRWDTDGGGQCGFCNG